MADNIQRAGINLTLQGEAEYISGLRSINRETQLLANETKLAVAQLGNGASPTKRYTTEMAHLTTQIDQSATATKVLRNRYKELPGEMTKGRTEIERLDKAVDAQRITTVKYHDEIARLKDDGFNHYSKEVQDATKAYNEQKGKLTELETELKNTTKAYDSMSEELENMPNEITKATIATQEMINKQQKMQEEYLKSGGVLSGFADKLESSGQKLQESGRQISDLGDSLRWISVGVLAAGGAAFSAYTDFEGAMRGAMKTNDEVVDSNGNVIYSYQDLEDGIRGLSKEIPVTSSEIAELAEIAGRLQVPTDEVVAFTEVVAKLGETTNLASEEAAEQLGKFINITGAGSDTTLNLANALVELGNSTAASEQETLRMSTRWASTGNIIGMSDDQILALSASVISLGIRTEAGGSAVQRSFLKINDAVLEGGDTLADFAKVAGMTSEDFKKAWQDDAAHALIPFLEGLNQTHEEGGNVNQILKDLGVTSVNELNTLLVLAGGYDQLAGNLELASDAYNETEESMMALNKEAELAYGTTLGKLRIAWNQLKDSLIDIGEPVAEAVLAAVEAADPLLKKVEEMADAFADLDEESQQHIISTIGSIALLSPALSIFGRGTTAVGNFLELLSKGTRTVGRWVTPATKGFQEVSDGAQTAAGSKGVGGLITKLAGSAGLPWALGIAAAALGGWVVWDQWGRDAYEASERTKRWGTDVGETTDGILTDMQTMINGTTGQFGLMQQGLSTDTEVMGGDFEKLGLTIEGSLTERIANLDNLIANLPETVRGALTELLEEDKKQAEESLAIVQENNEKIANIRAQAANQEKGLTLFQSKQLQDLNKESAEAYVNTLKISQSERKEILDAMNGDVESATKEQAKTWAIGLAEQRQEMKLHHDEQKETYLQALRDEGYSEAALAEHGAIWDEANSAMSLGLEQQLAIIAEKYPEILEEINFGTGQVINKNTDMGKSIARTNEDIIASAVEMGAVIEDTAIRNADKLKWMGDEATNAGETWNRIILDEKTGEIKTNVREAVIEAAEDASTWNHMRFQLKNADLDSNARLIIGEAAIANDWWDGMAWEDKEAVLKDNFSVTLYEALQANGTWDAMEPEEKIATLRNEFSQTVAQGLIDIGKWDSLDPKDQVAILTTNTPETLIQVMKDIGLWETLPIAVRDLIADATPAKKATQEAKRALDEYGNIIVNPPKVRVEDLATQKIRNIQGEINQLKGKKVYIDAITRAGGSASSRRFIESGGRMLERGTNSHAGGLAMVNDQLGGMFRELITLPNGESFIPHGRNVLLDLPKGSKVLRASLTRNRFPDLPQYERGVGVQTAPRTTVNNNTDMNETNSLLRQLTSLIRTGQSVQINIDGREVAKATIDHTNNENNKRMNYTNRGLAFNG